MMQAFELWSWRRVLRVSWRQRKINEWVREIIGVPERSSGDDKEEEAADQI